MHASRQMIYKPIRGSMATNFDRRITNSGRACGKGSHKGRRHSIDFLSTNHRERMQSIPNAMSRESRRDDRPARRRDGFTPMGSLLGVPSLKELFPSQGDIRNIPRRGGGNLKMRFELGAMNGLTTVAIRAYRGHSESSGVEDNVLPAAEDLVTLAHGTNSQASLYSPWGNIESRSDTCTFLRK